MESLRLRGNRKQRRQKQAQNKYDARGFKFNGYKNPLNTEHWERTPAKTRRLKLEAQAGGPVEEDSRMIL